MIILKNKKKLLALIGPTAVGKTTISINLSQRINGEIISADSMQIYKYMDIGTAKVTSEEMKAVPHHLIDIIYPDEEFTVAQYKDKASECINRINNSGKIPIIVGGTGLYLNSLVYELKFTNVEPNDELRKKYNDIADSHGNEYIFDKLSKVDPVSAKKINLNDRKRVIRALEIFYETGKPMSYYNKNFRKATDKYNLEIIGLTMDRSLLYSRINKRVDLMIQNGLIDEVQRLLNMGYTKDMVSMRGIGYKEIIPYIEGDSSLEETIKILKRNTRRYAKRQLTWFRRDKRIRWIDIDQFNSIDSITEYIIECIDNLLTY